MLELATALPSPLLLAVAVDGLYRTRLLDLTTLDAERERVSGSAAVVEAGGEVVRSMVELMRVRCECRE